MDRNFVCNLTILTIQRDRSYTKKAHFEVNSFYLRIFAPIRNPGGRRKIIPDALKYYLVASNHDLNTMYTTLLTATSPSGTRRFSLEAMINQARPSLVEIPEDASVGNNLRDRIYAELKRLILSGRVAPGEHLPETKLCQRLKVSRTPLREALNQLGHENLVIFRPNCGFVVAPLSAEDAQRLQELRRIVESKVAALAATFMIGLPFLVLAATSSLVQRWFRAGFPDRNPYRLYAVASVSGWPCSRSP